MGIRRLKTSSLVLGLNRVTDELGMEGVCAGLFGVRNSTKAETCNKSCKSDFGSGGSCPQAVPMLSHVLVRANAHA